MPKRSASSARAGRAAASAPRTRRKIDFSDIPDSSPEQLKTMRRVGRPPLGDRARQLIAVRVDADVLDTFRKVDRTGKYVLAANYGGGSITVLPIQEGGQLGAATAFVQHQGSSVNAQRQAGPHAHGIYLDPSNRYAFVCDLGLDKILCYRFDANRGALTPNEPPFTATQPGAGPRHFTFHPNGHFAYAINELNNTINVYVFDDKQIELKAVQTVRTLPDDFQGNSTTAEIAVHPSGKFLYGSNRGHDSLAAYLIDNQNGMLKLVGIQSTQGKAPRSFAIDPAGRFLVVANQSTHDLRVFRIDLQTGRLTPTGQVVEVGAPVCIQFLP